MVFVIFQFNAPNMLSKDIYAFRYKIKQTGRLFFESLFIVSFSKLSWLDKSRKGKNIVSSKFGSETKWSWKNKCVLKVKDLQ